jgi:hypothetical protein
MCEWIRLGQPPAAFQDPADVARRQRLHRKLGYGFKLWLTQHIMQRSHPSVRNIDVNSIVYQSERPLPPFDFILLGVAPSLFWVLVLGIQATLLCVCAACLVFTTSLSMDEAVTLALSTTGLGVSDNLQCPSLADSTRLTHYLCLVEIMCFSFLEIVFMLVIGGLVVVRIFRGSTHDRVIFSRVAVINNGQLTLRMSSNRPSPLVQLSFRMYVITSDGGYTHIPIPLDKQDSIAFLRDVTVTLRHVIDEHSPFSDPDWRHKLAQLCISVEAFDELLGSSISGRQVYLIYPQDHPKRPENSVFAGRFEDVYIDCDHELSGSKMRYVDGTKINEFVMDASEMPLSPLAIDGADAGGTGAVPDAISPV